MKTTPTAAGLLALACLWTAWATASTYLGPQGLVATADGNRLYVAEADAAEIAVVDRQQRAVIKRLACPAPPTGMALSADGRTLYASCGVADGFVALFDAESGKPLGRIEVGHSPMAPVLSPDGKRLYVANRFNNNVSVIDLAKKREIARIATVREPVDAAITPDGKTLVVADLLPLDRSDSYQVAAHIHLIDTASGKAARLRLPNGSTGVHGVCVSPDGKYACAVHILARYQMPTTQLERGWMNTNALTLIDLKAKRLINTVLLDDVDLGAANPWDVAVSSDGKWIAVTLAGTHELCVIDAPGMLAKLAAMPKTIEEARSTGRYDDRGSYSSIVVADVPNDLAFLVDLKRRIPLEGQGPRSLALVGGTAYVGMYFSDSLAEVELAPARGKVVRSVGLGEKPVLSVVRQGELFFHDASLCFQHWQSCASCHPDARVDALNWDLMNDGLGNPKNNKSMLLSHRTPPSMSTGIRDTAELAVRSGITHIQFAVRPEEDAVAIDEYLKALEPVPSPYLVDGRLSAAAERGKELFASARTGCAHCHPAPLFTDLKLHNVNSRGKYDRHDDFDTPTLVECWRTAPYMHDGHWLTIKELLTAGKHGHPSDGSEPLNEQEMDDLVEYVLSL